MPRVLTMIVERCKNVLRPIWRRVFKRPKWTCMAADFTLVHAAQKIERRVGDFTLNLCGFRGDSTAELRYRLNQAPWQSVRPRLPRVPADLFTIELPANELNPGGNQVDFEVTCRRGPLRRLSHRFEYDESLPRLPLERRWCRTELDAGDGIWETVEHSGEAWVRPRPGCEHYDRMLIVAGAFPRARRVSLDVIFRGSLPAATHYGFGVLPLWGGRPDAPGVSPRHGWRFSLLWYYSHYGGVGMEFSERFGDAAPDWVSVYRNIELLPGQRFRLVAEAWPELDARGRHLGFRQRGRWTAAGSEPGPWFELADTQGAPIAPGDYGVALLCHRVQAEFGPVRVEAL